MLDVNVGQLLGGPPAARNGGNVGDHRLLAQGKSAAGIQVIRPPTCAAANSRSEKLNGM